ncbi:hypothetical protein JTE90_021328 [Oedothorax gibbosus]|uniref:Uncharacterized protein n=1 Tax=Oedothorax gibbosus TaxID=931172 RepID=A0AAV6VPF8_9ARAC|nr:hypothetical protein JTE90_021328 [Oedothorax gibbosus]
MQANHPPFHSKLSNSSGTFLHLEHVTESLSSPARLFTTNRRAAQLDKRSSRISVVFCDSPYLGYKLDCFKELFSIMNYSDVTLPIHDPLFTLGTRDMGCDPVTGWIATGFHSSIQRTDLLPLIGLLTDLLEDYRKLCTEAA